MITKGNIILLRYVFWFEEESKNSFQIIPAWHGYHELMWIPQLNPINAGYLRPMPQSSTDMRVIYAEIERTMNEFMKNEFIFIEADQAIHLVYKYRYCSINLVIWPRRGTNYN